MLFYPQFAINAGQWWQYLFPLAAIALPIALWFGRSYVGRGPLAAVLIFSGVMVPALGFFNIYFMMYSPVSDHFQYHASVALIALAAAGATTAATKLSPQGRRAAVAVAGIVLGALLTLTFRQTFIYHDLETLYRDTIEKNPQSWIAYLNLSTHLDFLGRDEEALEIAQQGLRVKPDSPRMHACLGNVLGQLSAVRKDADQRRQAVAQYQEAVRLDPALHGWLHFAGIYGTAREHGRGEGLFPAHAGVRCAKRRAIYGLGAIAGLEDHWSEAERRFVQALTLNPQLTDAQNDLTIALVRQGKTAEAVRHLTGMLQRDVERADLHYELANVLVARDDLPSAAQHYSEAVRLQPGYIAAIQNLGAALFKMGDVDRAMGCFSETLRLDPSNEQARRILNRPKRLSAVTQDLKPVRRSATR